MAAVREHQVVIVCGETGSGKTTQLPKIALALGRGAMHARTGEKPRLIGHTQPRRIAASSVAKRIAEELKTPLGEVVGYKVRFQDRLQKGASVKLMTDGILLAETQSDPLLKAYDTLIIDEAHERSLNIDFLLGYLKEILPRRPDLKVIVTSATIDADRFAQHFASRKGPAPVLMVSGRLYPVEVRYRPFEDSKDTDLNTSIADAVDELWRSPTDTGDILVFLPGEREIREAADHLRKHLSHSPVLRNTEVLPLFARLSQAEQDRVFDSHGGRRIVLATNVAETSLTVPGIRYVIDAGTARVKRYSYRNKVEQLLVEPVSQAAANQRAGRCGRVANGICIRLYDEKDFNSRPRFTDPEILRSSLAGVILRMQSLHLGEVERFPFLEAPRPKAIADGYQLLNELGAVDGANQLTDVGRALSRLPLDPRIGRILLEANARGALDEALVIASALSVQDVRDRPLEQQAQADQAQAKFDDEKSEFVSTLKLWQWLHEARGGTPSLPSARAQQAAQSRKGASQAVLPVAQRLVAAPQEASANQPEPAGEGHRNQAGTGKGPQAQAARMQSANAVSAAGTAPTHKLSNRQYESLLRQNFINVRRVREWRDIHSQLLTVAGEQGWKHNVAPASYAQLHQSMLAGLLGNVGVKSEDEDWYLGARGIKFWRHPGAHLRKKPGRWIACAELVETTRLFGRGIANIEPQWLEEVGGHLLRKQLLDPHWEKKAGKVVALERATLYGIVVYNNRRVDYDRIDPVSAREIFIRQALVGDDWESSLPFLAANRKMVRQVEELEHKSRRQDVLVDDELIYAFYDAQIPADVTNAHQLEKWFRSASKSQPRLLQISREELMRHEATGITTDLFPRTIRLGGVDCRATYLHQPGDARDGVTVEVPLFALNQVSEDRAEWLVPGMLKDKIQALLKSLPQRPRSRFVPLPESATRLAAQLQQDPGFAKGSLTDALLKAVRDQTSLDVKRNDFKLDMLPPHLFMNLRVTEEHGRQLGMGRNLGALKAELGSQARGAFQALAVLRQDLRSAPPDAQQTAAPNQHAGAGARKGDEKTHADRAQADKPARQEQGATASKATELPEDQRYTSWSFGELPEIMEMRRGRQTLIGFPALIDQGNAVSIEVFDEPEVAAARHRSGLRRLFALQVKDALKYLEKNLPDFQKMAAAYMPLGTAEELRQQILDVAMDRAFLGDSLPTDAEAFAKRVDEGRGRLSLIAQEVARQAGVVLTEFAVASRKIKDTKIQPDAVADATQQLQRLCGKRFLAETPWPQLQHLPRYLKAITLRLDKLRADPARDAQKMAEHKPLEQRYWRLVAERKGQLDARMQEFRWLLEELRVSFFAQELRTPQPVSVKRLEKAWQQLVY
ncbi:ATP-dependent RNA helicase HrpA [Brachymonas denitrificans]|uniref:ATP-dependent RNA helicase HrpA n=1 Tax=Brachymonas denitrificans TaxID=28220 RepID=UPI003D2FDF7F